MHLLIEFDDPIFPGGPSSRVDNTELRHDLLSGSLRFTSFTDRVDELSTPYIPLDREVTNTVGDETIDILPALKGGVLASHLRITPSKDGRLSPIPIGQTATVPF
jgi:hypothetical protein